MALSKQGGSRQTAVTPPTDGAVPTDGSPGEGKGTEGANVTPAMTGSTSANNHKPR